MIDSLAEATKYLAIWVAAETRATHETSSVADLKAATAKAATLFVKHAYEVAFELTHHLLRHEGEVITKSETRYTATATDGGIVVQKMDMDQDNPGLLLHPERASTENFLQLMIDLPELLFALMA